MNLRNKLFWKKTLEYSLPALISAFIFLLAMLIKGIAPFGPNQMGYIDFNDGLIPSYTGLWDFLHGNIDSAVVSWKLGSGGSLFASWVASGGFISPISWLIALFPRNSIIYSISFLFIIRLALMATTVYICFKKFFKNTDKYILLFFSILWTFSNWTLVHLTNISWLDLMILLPILFIALEKLINENKTFWFVIILSYCLLLSYYISFMILVGIVSLSILYIALLSKNKKENASNLFFSIIISLLISFVLFIPSCLTSLQGHRFVSTATNDGKFEILFDSFLSKLLNLTMFAIPFIFFVKLILKCKQDKNALFFLISFIILTLGILIEPINKMWHTGSYYSFPLRYSFIIIFLLIFGSLYYINNYVAGKNSEPEKPNYWPSFLTICFGVLSLLTTILYASLCNNLHPHRSISFSSYYIPLLCFIFTYLFIESCLKIKSKKLSLCNIKGGILIFIICLIQVISFTSGFIGISIKNDNKKYQNIISNCLQINVDSLDDQYKLKDKDCLYAPNMAYLTNFPTMSTWIHISSEEQYQAYAKMGYNTYSTLLYSSGGTLLTDILMGNKYVLSKKELNPTFYNKLNEFVYESDINEGDLSSPLVKTTVYLYEINLDMCPIFTTNTDLTTILNNFNTEQCIEVQNETYKALFNTTENIMEELDFNIEIEDNLVKVSATVPTNKMIYLENNLNDLTITHNNFSRLKFKGLVDFDFIESGTLEFSFDNKENLYSLDHIKENFRLASFDAYKFKETYENNFANNNSKIEFDKTKLSISLNNVNNKKYAFIPYIYLNNLTGSVNENPAEVSHALDSFMVVNLSDGINNIVIKHTPQYLKICAIITAVALIVFITIVLLNKKFKIQQNKYIVWIGFIGGCLLSAVVCLLIYLKPFINLFTILFS